MLERVDRTCWFCNNCSHDWVRAERPPQTQGRFASLDDLVATAGLRRAEVVTLADIGALNSFGYDRRSALWQAERAVRPSGELFTTETAELAEHAESFPKISLRTLRVLPLDQLGARACRGMRLTWTVRSNP
jgi:DNA polymerase III alpha subunit